MSDLPNECHCGCGEFLPIGSKREYKRGHRQRVTENYEDKLAEALPEGEGSEFWGDSPTLEDIAAITPDDPLPFDLKNTKGNAPDIKITKRVRDDVEGKIAFMISVTGSMAAMIDPVCGGAFLANGDAVAGKLTPIICKSPEAVQWFRKSSNFMLYLDLLVACWPIMTAIFAHHMAKDRHVITDATMPPMPDNAYSAA